MRVLVSNGSSNLGNQHVKYVGSFFQLRFLSIGSRRITELREDIGDLRYLQTLDTRGSGITKLPPSIGHLQKLMRLLVNNDVELPDSIGDLQALQELSRARILSIKLVEALRRLTKLKRLHMDMPSTEQLGHDMGRYQEALKSSLAVMGDHGLQALKICDYNGFLREELMDILCHTAPCLQKIDVYGTGIACLPKHI